MRYVLVVLDVVAVGPVHLEYRGVGRHQCLELCRRVVGGCEVQGFHAFGLPASQEYAEAQVAVVKLLFLLEIGCRERFFVGLGESRGLVMLVMLPEHDPDLVVGEVLAPENPKVLIGFTVLPTVAIACLDPGAVCVGDAVALVAE